MSTLSIVLLIGSLTSLVLLASYLDAKFQWRLNDWMNGECSNPFVKSVTDKQQHRRRQVHVGATDECCPVRLRGMGCHRGVVTGQRIKGLVVLVAHRHRSWGQRERTCITSCYSQRVQPGCQHRHGNLVG